MLRQLALMILQCLPLGSPELNPMENLWHYLRSHHWSNRNYESVEDLFDAAVTAWRATGLDPTIIRTVCHAPYAETRRQFMESVGEE